MEEYAYILDYLPMGTPGGNFGKKEPLCYAVGDNEFKLFELVPKASINIGDRVYIGKDNSKRTEIDHVKRRIGAQELSRAANAELDYAVEAIVKANETRFIRFYNEAEPISMRKHLLEELPGLGKKTMQAILDDRSRNGAFKDFADLATRVPAIKTPEKLIAARIVLEIRDPDRKRYLFVSR
jgi:putative nucleotide binding protein